MIVNSWWNRLSSSHPVYDSHQKPTTILINRLGKNIMARTRQTGKTGTKDNRSTKEIILNKAQEMILERGYENVCIDDIVAACGLTKGAFYYNFKSKRDLLQLPITRHQFNSAARRLDETEPSAYERIFAYLRIHTKFHEENGKNIVRAWMLEHTDPKSRTETTKGNNAFPEDVAHFTRFIRDAVEQGSLKADTPVDFLAYGIGLTLYGRTYVELLTDEEEKPTSWVERWLIPYVRDIILAPYHVPQEEQGEGGKN